MPGILAIDLGTHTGFCSGEVGIGAPVPEAGTITWATQKEIAQFGRMRLDRTGDPRIVRFNKWLRAKIDSQSPDAIVFEDVLFSTYTKQVQLWSSFRTVLWLAASECRVPTVECVPVTTLKKYAAGSGTADKPAMAAALKRQYPEFSKKELGDDAVDAIFLWLWARETLARR